MIAKPLKLRIALVLLSVIFLVLIITTEVFLADVNSEATDDSNSVRPREKPIIIWYHTGEQESTLSLKTALASGLITHVAIKYRSPADGPWNAERKVREAIEVVKKSNAKLVWGRDLWARWVVGSARIEDIFDPYYYIRQIRALRAEAKEMGADFVFLDTEAYGNSPMRPYLLSSKRVFLSNEEHQRLKAVIESVIRKTGKVDFIAPAGYWGYPGHNHPWDVLANLGEFRIAENTYYDNPIQRNAIKYPYEIFGVFLNTTKEHKESPHNLYFLVSEIFESSDLWSHKRGLYLYMSAKRSQAVAEALLDYSKTIPFRDSAKSGEPNRP